jgi:hypothetical protein
MRKTIDVERIREIANGMLARSDDDRADGREAIATLVESILMETGNYRGFRYLEIVRDGAENVVTFGDETRREYLA